MDLAGLPPDIRKRLEERARSPERRLMVGRYVIIGELGRGGMGVVYDAWDPGIERRVAIKTMDPDLVPEEDRDEVVERFRRETKIVGRLHHPGIVTIFDYGEDRDGQAVGGGFGASRLFYYVMEHLEGQSLSRVLRDRRTLPDLQAIRIVSEILDALHVTHKAGVVHRDIKPSNIFLRGGTRAVLLDFGIAKTSSVALTRHGQILGTPSFLAPERLREKEKPVDGRADIFSLGILLFTMIVGDPPFTGEDVYDVIDKIAKSAHPKLTRTTPSGQALSRVMDRMLAKRPEDRYATADEAALALRQVERMMTSTGEGASAPSISSRPDLPSEAIRTEISKAFDLPRQSVSESEVDTGRARIDSSLERVVDELEAASRSEGRATEHAAPAPLPPRTELPLARPETPNPVRTVVASAPITHAPEQSDEELQPFGAESTLEGRTDRGEELGPSNDAMTLADGGPDLNALDDNGLEAEETARDSGPRGAPVPPASLAPKRGGQDERSTEQMGRAHEDAGPTPAAAQSTGRVRRSRIEASLVDEEDVVLKPSAFDVSADEEMPTRAEASPARLAREPAPRASSRPPLSSSIPDIRLHGASRVQDPAELRRGQSSISSDTDPSAPMAEAEGGTSAAVARRTFSARADKLRPRRASTLKMAGGIAPDRLQLVRRRLFVLFMALLGAVGVGLFLSRMDQPRPSEGAQGEPREPLLPRARKPDDSVSSGALAASPVSELLQEASMALSEGEFGKAKDLFERALQATHEKEPLRAQAILGRADALRQLKQEGAAIQGYRALLVEFPKGVEADNARAALRELGVHPVVKIARPSAPAKPEEAEPSKEPAKDPAQDPAAEKETAEESGPAEVMPVELRCELIVKQHLGDPEKVVQKLSDLMREQPHAPCVYQALGRAYTKLNDDRAALAALKRYLELAPPDAPNRAAVEDRIKNLANKLEER